jgi:hypothetical protein
MAEMLTAQTVSALLSNAGFARSEETAGTPSGGIEYSAGFAVKDHLEDGIWIRHRMGPFMPGRHSEPIPEMLAKYGDALVAGGLSWEARSEAGMAHALIVTKWENADG